MRKYKPIWWQKTDQWLPGVGKGYEVYKGSSGGDRYAYYINGHNFPVYTYVKTDQIIWFKNEKLIVCQL